jgi:hypothetical protein
VLGDEVLGDVVLPELELLPMLELSLGATVLPLDALPCGQFVPTQFDELAPADELPVAEVDEGLVELEDDDGVLGVAPADVLPVADPLVPPDADVLELGVPVVAPADVLPELLLPLCAHAAQRNAAATAAVMAFRTICKPPIGLNKALRGKASKRSAHVRNTLVLASGSLELLENRLAARDDLVGGVIDVGSLDQPDVLAAAQHQRGRMKRVVLARKMHRNKSA